MVEAARIEPEAANLPATATAGHPEANSGQSGSPDGRPRTDIPPTHVEEWTEPVASGTSTGHAHAPITPPRDLFYLAWAWPQLPESMRVGILSLVNGHINARAS